MSTIDYTKLTNDPILLEALQAPEAELAKVRSKSNSRYRGISKNSNSKSTTWSASVGCRKKEYNCGTYKSETEAALARNFGENLMQHPKPVQNVIPVGDMPDEAIQRRIAMTVVSLLKAQGALSGDEAIQGPPLPPRDAPSDKNLPPK